MGAGGSGGCAGRPASDLFSQCDGGLQERRGGPGGSGGTTDPFMWAE